MATEKSGPGDTTVMYTRIPKWLNIRLDELVSREGISKSSAIVLLLRAGLDQLDGKDTVAHVIQLSPRKG